MLTISNLTFSHEELSNSNDSDVIFNHEESIDITSNSNDSDVIFNHEESTDINHHTSLLVATTSTTSTTSTISTSSSFLSENDCPICFEESINSIVFDCKHTICLKCLQKIYWTQGPKKKILCPLCRNQIDDIYKKVIHLPAPISEESLADGVLQSPSVQTTNIRCLYRITIFFCFAGLCYMFGIIIRR